MGRLFASGFGAVGMLGTDADLRRQQFGNAGQVVGDQIEHEVFLAEFCGALWNATVR
jgi:hypothetical protein